ncbi:mitochondrial inner membrane protein oxa1l-like [Venturia nashicola]|nr:mitochondrial inner membrane protein oxa1l-like [Venturia nashicola]
MLPFKRPPLYLRQAHHYYPLRSQRGRQFHASPRRNGPAEDLLFVPHGFLVALHDTGLTWAAVIPVAAISVRLLTLTFFAVPARHEHAKINEIVPLVSAQALNIREQTERDMLENPHLLAKKSAQDLYKDRLKILAADLFRQHGVMKKLTFLPILQLPVFLIMAETLRRMMGMQSGFLSTKDTANDGESAILSTVTPDSNTLSDASNWYEPTMASEGPYFIMDLTASDPTLILPLAVSGLMLANLRYGQHRTSRQGLPRSRFSRTLHNTLMGASIMIFPATLHVPAGFLYYWACTSASSLAADIIMDKMLPLRPVVRPCRRPRPSLPKLKPKTAV